MRLRLDNKGFSLIEVFFTILIMGIVVVSFYKLPSFFAKTEKAVSTVVTKDRLFKNFSQNFIQIAERSDLAFRFQNFPISTACAAGKPCVRLLQNAENNQGTFSDAAFEDPASVQFFRDERGELSPKELPSKYNTKILSRVPFNFERTFLEKEYYATWPLVDADSQPFVVMKRGELADHFLVEDAFVSSRRVNDWVIVKGTRRGLDLKKVLGRPMLIYDVQDPTQYSAQRVIDAEDCSVGEVKNHCYAVAKEIKESFDPAQAIFGEVGNSKLGKTFDEIPFYIFRMKPFASEELKFEAAEAAPQSKNRSRNFLPSTGTSPSTWVGQDDGNYLFPSSVASVFAPDVGDLKAPVDAKLLGHFTHVVPGGAFALLPFDLVTYQLEDVYHKEGGAFTKSKEGKKQLVSHSLANKSSEVVLADIDEKDQIIFARRLGRSEFSVFHLK